MEKAIENFLSQIYQNFQQVVADAETLLGEGVGSEIRFRSLPNGELSLWINLNSPNPVRASEEQCELILRLHKQLFTTTWIELMEAFDNNVEHVVIPLPSSNVFAQGIFVEMEDRTTSKIYINK